MSKKKILIFSVISILTAIAANADTASPSDLETSHLVNMTDFLKLKVTVLNPIDFEPGTTVQVLIDGFDYHFCAIRKKNRGQQTEVVSAGTAYGVKKFYFTDSDPAGGNVCWMTFALDSKAGFEISCEESCGWPFWSVQTLNDSLRDKVHFEVISENKPVVIK